MAASKGHRVVLRGAVYYIVWPGNTRGRSTGTGNRALADKQLATFILSGDPDQVTGSDLTVSQMVEDYMTEHARPKISATEQAKIAQAYFGIHFTERLATSVTEEDVAAYVKARRECRLKITRTPKPAGNGTIRRELGMLVAAYNHAIRKKRLPPGSAPHVKPPPAPPAKDRWLTAAEEDALIAACDMEIPAMPARKATKTRRALPERPARLSRIYRFVILAADTAARKEALETLMWQQVDFQAGTIALNPSHRLQTKKRRSVVPMSRRLREVLDRAHRERNSNYVLDNGGDVRTSFDLAVKKSGLQGVTPHTLRHTWATRAARAGVPMIDVADMLGDDLRTVEKNYRHQSPAHLKGAADWRDREKAA